MTKEQLEELKEHYPELLLADGYDDCLIGVCHRINQPDIACYDETKVIAKLAKEMTHEEAIEYYEFNIIGSYMGELTPCFVALGEDL